MAPAPHRRLRRTLGVAGLTFYGVGMIVGAGIYSVVGAAAESAGEGLWLSALIGAAVALLTAFSYAELSTMMPHAGAEYAYVRAGFPRLRSASAVVGVVLVLTAAATAATVALAFAGYLERLLGVPRAVGSGALVVAATALNLSGMRSSSRVNAAFTLIEVAGLAVFVVLGATQPSFGAALAEAPAPGVLPGAALLFFAYLGFEDIVNLAEEARRPSRTLPRALFVSVAVTAALYVGVALAAVALVEPAELATSRSPLATAAEAASPSLAGALGGVALFATANTALIALVAGCRLLFGMARDGDLPAGLAAVHRRTGVPWLAALLVGGIAAALLPVGEVAVVAGVSSFAALMAFTSVNAALVALRLRAPGRRRPFRVPLAWRRIPVLPVLGGVSALLLLTQFDGPTYLGGAGVLGVGILVQVLYRTTSRSRASEKAGTRSPS